MGARETEEEPSMKRTVTVQELPGTVSLRPPSVTEHELELRRKRDVVVSILALFTPLTTYQGLHVLMRRKKYERQLRMKAVERNGFVRMACGTNTRRRAQSRRGRKHAP